MPKFSPEGQYILSTEIGTVTTDWWWLSADLAIGYRYDIEPQGLYVCQFPALTFKYVGPYQYTERLSFHACGTGSWLGDYVSGPWDSDGVRWDPNTHGANGLGDRNERLFVRKPDFAALIISRDGVEELVQAPGYTNYTLTMRGGFLMWDSASGPRDQGGSVIGPRGAMQTFHLGADGQKWCTGYVGDWGLCLWRWGSMRGYNLSQDAYDFYPGVFADSSARVRVCSTQTQADSQLRVYDVRFDEHRFLTQDGQSHLLIEHDLSQPPQVTPPVEPPVVIEPPPVKPPITPPVKPPITPPITPPVKPPIVPPVHPRNVSALASRFFLKGR